jgi:hypothetical protein
MKPLDEKLAALSDEAKCVAMFELRGPSPITVFQLNNSFFGPVYDAALNELRAAGVITELIAPTHYISVYEVHHDLEPLAWWYVGQNREYREKLVEALSRRTPDDRDIAKAVRRIGHCIEMIAAQRHAKLDPVAIIDDIDRYLGELRLELVGPGPRIEKNKRFPVIAQYQLDASLKNKDIEKALQGLKAQEGGDPEKSRYEWYFAVGDEKCAIWDWKGAWCAFGPPSAFERLGISVKPW